MTDTKAAHVRKARGAVKRPRPARGIRGIRARLVDAEATLEAIRAGEVDALVVTRPGGARTLAIEGATHPYYVLLDAMSDGAALLASDGTILFGNRRLSEIARRPAGRLRGSRFQRLITSAERPDLEQLLRDAAGRKSAREFAMVRGDVSTPVWVALSTVAGRNGATVLMAIVTDMTRRKRAEVARLDLLRRLITAEDAERRRIARELHDETGQSLTALLVGLRAIEHHAISSKVQSAARRLRKVAANTVDNVGRLARGLHPSVLDDLGLAAASRRYVSDFAKSFGVVVDLKVQRIAAHVVQPLAQTTMYRILQEALTNVARHSRARRVAVELKRSGAMLALVVQDDGVGFDMASALRVTQGLGLHGMHERVALLGGSVEVDSKPGNGARIQARVPLGTVASPRRARP